AAAGAAAGTAGAAAATGGVEAGTAGAAAAGTATSANPRPRRPATARRRESHPTSVPPGHSLKLTEARPSVASRPGRASLITRLGGPEYAEGRSHRGRGPGQRSPGQHAVRSEERRVGKEGRWGGRAG